MQVDTVVHGKTPSAAEFYILVFDCFIKLE